MAFLFIVFGAVGSLLTFCLVDAYWERGTRGRLRLLAVGALVAGTGVGAFVGYSSLAGSGCPPARSRGPGRLAVRRERLRSLVQIGPHPLGRPAGRVARAFAYASPDYVQFRPSPELRELTDEQLCRRWRASYKSSQRQQSSAVKLIAAVAERQMYLDELERRNARGFAAWLAAGPQTAGDPLPYLTGDRVDASGRRLGRADSRTGLVAADPQGLASF